MSTCTIPLITRRSSARSTPRTSVGKCGSIRAHCSSLSQNRFLPMNLSPNTNQYRIVEPERLMSSDPSLITPDALPILGDRIQLQQVILNLVVNGIDAMKDTPSENRIISIRTACVENFAQLSVSDRGPGIPEDKLKELFEPLFTTKAEGMGMGLSIARTIIEAHHGLIWAKNRDHGGASFRIRLPLVS